jgi:SDR family mycofactocin-dependent oxidoreductase
MGRVQDKVAFITGAARGQGRSHAVRLAEEGADIIAVDICSNLDTVTYSLASQDDLAETAELVEKLGRRVITETVDVRDLPALESAVAVGVKEFGHIDIVCANAGIGGYAPAWELSEEQWNVMLDVNLTGVWKTTKAVIPTMLKQNTGGSIIITSSVAGLVGELGLAHYTASKHGVNGLMRALAGELAPHSIRVNSVNPCTVMTPMIDNHTIFDLFTGGRKDATWDDVREASQKMNALPTPWIESIDVSNAVLYLASDEARFVTGTTHMIDAGAMAPLKAPHL